MMIPVNRYFREQDGGTHTFINVRDAALINTTTVGDSLNFLMAAIFDNADSHDELESHIDYCVAQLLTLKRNIK